jgi:hypothetical protein
MFTRQDSGLMLVGTALSLAVSPRSAEIYLHTPATRWRCVFNSLHKLYEVVDQEFQLIFRICRISREILELLIMQFILGSSCSLCQRSEHFHSTLFSNSPNVFPFHGLRVGLHRLLRCIHCNLKSVRHVSILIYCVWRFF